MCVSECEIAATSIHPTAFSRRCRYTIAMQITRSKMQVSSVTHVRWVVLLLAIMLHALAIEWAGGHIGLPAMHSPSQTALIAQLHAAQTLHAARVATPNAAAAPKPDRPKPAAKRAPSSSRKRTSISAEPPLSQPAPAAAQTPEAETAMQSADHSVPPDGTPLPAVSSQADMPQQVALAAPALPHGDNSEAVQKKANKSYRVSLLPSAQLDYDVVALRDGQKVYGRGKIDWQSDGGNFTIDGEAGILFFTLLSFKSSGVVDDFGVSPVLYSEKRFRKSETNTHFHRERNTISFSASTASYPRKGGEQDRASIVWQLAGIGRGDGEKFVPGEEINFFVAGVRDAETWQIRVVAEEEIDTYLGKTKAWHVVRMPRPGSYDQKIDIWLAPQQGWYPVKLRYTETSGDYLDMSLSNLKLAADEAQR